MSNTTPPLRFLQGNAYVLPGEWSRVRPWLGVVITQEGAVLIDSGNGPAQAESLQAALAPLGEPPITHILLTHHHWDHVFGNCAFPQATIVAHEQTQEHLEVMAREPWSAAYVRDKVAGWPTPEKWLRIMSEAVINWESFQAVPATETFAETFTLHLGQTVFHVKHVGGQHEPDQCIVLVQPANVLFLGDALYGRGPQRAWDKPALAASLEGFLELEADWYAAGHDAPEQPAAFRERIARLRQEKVK